MSDPGPENHADESTSLLRKPTNDGNETDGRYNDKLAFSSSLRSIATEFWILLKGAGPVILAYAGQNMLQTTSVLVVGRRSPEDLSVASFCYMFAMASAWLIGLGGSTAIDTIASASYTGSQNKHDLGIILQRAFFVLSLFYIPVIVLWIFTEPIFRALGQPEYICTDGSKFLWVLIPGGLGYIYFECMKKYLQSQELMRAGTYVLCITLPANIGLNYLFVYTLDMGLLGAPVATGISYWLSFLLAVLYTRFIAGSECWGGWSRQCFQNMGQFAKIAALGIVQVGTEWWAFEIVAIVAGQLGRIPLAAQSVIMNADQVMYTIPFGQGVAASARIGNLLGSRDAQGARRAAHCAAWLSMLLGALVLAILMGTKDNFARLFNDDEDVVRLTAEVLPWVALFQIADGLNGSCGGVLRGMGRQHIGAAVNIVSYYCGALPLGIYLAFNGWSLTGLWFGQCLALYLVGFAEWAIVAFSNWEKQVENAFKRMDVSERVEEDDEERTHPVESGGQP